MTRLDYLEHAADHLGQVIANLQHAGISEDFKPHLSEIEETLLDRIAAEKRMLRREGVRGEPDGDARYDQMREMEEV